MSKKKNTKNKSTINSFEFVQKYGTYEIQETADTDNEYPMISQGKAKSVNNLKPHQPK